MCRKKLENPPENHYKFWENDVMRLLGKECAGVTAAKLGEKFGRTPGAILTRIHILKIVIRMSPYKDEILPVLKYRQSVIAKKRAATPEGKKLMEKARRNSHTPEAEAKRLASFKKTIEKRKANSK